MLIHVLLFTYTFSCLLKVCIVGDSRMSTAVADPGENLTGALLSNFERGGCGGRG